MSPDFLWPSIVDYKQRSWGCSILGVEDGGLIIIVWCTSREEMLGQLVCWRRISMAQEKEWLFYWDPRRSTLTALVWGATEEDRIGVERRRSICLIIIDAGWGSGSCKTIWHYGPLPFVDTGRRLGSWPTERDVAQTWALSFVRLNDYFFFGEEQLRSWESMWPRTHAAQIWCGPPWVPLSGYEITRVLIALAWGSCLKKGWVTSVLGAAR